MTSGSSPPPPADEHTSPTPEAAARVTIAQVAASARAAVTATVTCEREGRADVDGSRVNQPAAGQHDHRNVEEPGRAEQQRGCGVGEPESVRHDVGELAGQPVVADRAQHDDQHEDAERRDQYRAHAAGSGRRGRIRRRTWWRCRRRLVRCRASLRCACWTAVGYCARPTSAGSALPRDSHDTSPAGSPSMLAIGRQLRAPGRVQVSLVMSSSCQVLSNSGGCGP